MLASTLPRQRSDFRRTGPHVTSLVGRCCKRLNTAGVLAWVSLDSEASLGPVPGRL